MDISKLSMSDLHQLRMKHTHRKYKKTDSKYRDYLFHYFPAFVLQLCIDSHV